MKSSFQPKFYFSAYPLKALNLPEEEKKSYLHIYTSKDRKLKSPSRTKVMPMINPYKESVINKQVAEKTKPSDKIEERDSDWFANYE